MIRMSAGVDIWLSGNLVGLDKAGFASCDFCDTEISCLDRLKSEYEVSHRTPWFLRVFMAVSHEGKASPSATC